MRLAVGDWRYLICGRDSNGIVSFGLRLKAALGAPTSGFGEDVGAGGLEFLRRQVSGGEDRVFVDFCRGVEVIEGEVQVAVLIEVGDGGAGGRACVIQAPGSARFLKCPFSGVAKGLVGDVAVGHIGDHLQVGSGAGEAGTDELEVVQRIGPAFDAVGDEYVRAAIAVEVFDEAAPAPVGGGEAGHFGDLGEVAAAAVPLQGVVGELVVIAEFSLELVYVPGVGAHGGFQGFFVAGAHVEGE